MNYSFIYHSGIKGQKWGIRRYQYLDRTLTPEGKIRYAKIGTTVGQSGQKISSNVASIDRTISGSRYAKKHKAEIAKMSNKELQGREGTSRTLSTYKRYPDEPTDGRIVLNGIKGQDIAVTIDGNPFVVQLDPLTIDSYNRGAVSQGALCNAVLKAYDEQYSGVSERYERVVKQQEQEQLDQTLALK